MDRIRGSISRAIPIWGGNDGVDQRDGSGAGDTGLNSGQSLKVELE